MASISEGLNNKAKVTMKKSYGFRTYRVLELGRITSDESKRKGGQSPGVNPWSETRS
jgi:hypothetical protein